MATKSVAVCDREHQVDVLARHRNRWVNPKGETRKIDLCDDHQDIFLKAWAVIDEGSTLVTTRQGTPPTKAQIIRAWANQEGIEVNEAARIPFNVELQWKEAGSPNILEL